MIKAFVHIQSFKGNSKFSTWLTRIAINEALMIVRRVKVESRHRLNDADVLETPRVLGVRDRRPGADPETQCAQREQKAMLWQAVRRLEASSRAIVYSLGFAEADARQLAEISHLSCSGVRSRRQRALRSLRAILGRKFTRNDRAIQELA
jgi:RNA polymerase sigma-70 factor (ECF subfamily)